ncbi:plasmid partitioning protein RepB (plasmid) [Microvirga ossetica]|uniref:Plasmid partitioning protein RepB n=2 Tax=Microvirga ossetica TaxID=1882682 RepID=A0A1B2EYZ4_9HYPH|nr:plasmid partitioning protein RepB [Microvirga ossetica]
MGEGLMARDLQAILKANLEQTDEVESPKTVVQMPKQPQPNVDEKRSRFAAMMTEGRAPVGAMGAALENMKGQSEAEISALKAQIESGQTIVEIETDKIDRSFVSDRMDESDDALTSLKEQIKSQGQIVPILVRPHPGIAGRYQIAFGHRRVAAAAALGIKVRAVVKDLSDEDLVIAQGQENNERLDLSYIERARFAATLEERKFTRATIMAALSVRKGDLSSLISIASKIPVDIIDAIGRAPGIGRPRWLDFLELILGANSVDRAREIIKKPDFVKLESDERFLTLFAKLSKKERAAPQNLASESSFWKAPDGRRLARVNDTETKYTLQIDKSIEPEFGSFVFSMLDELYAAYKANKQ